MEGMAGKLCKPCCSQVSSFCLLTFLLPAAKVMLVARGREPRKSHFSPFCSPLFSCKCPSPVMQRLHLLLLPSVKASAVLEARPTFPGAGMWDARSREDVAVPWLVLLCQPDVL